MPAFAFIDLAGFTALTEAHGDESAATVAARFYAMAARALVGDTRVVKRIGDAVMLVGSSVVTLTQTVLALAAAIETTAEFPGLRAGVHCGNAVERDGDYFGAAVNLTARVAAHARCGQILCTQVVARALEAAAVASCLPCGMARFKNVPEPVAIFFLDREPASCPSVDADPVCQMQIDRTTAAASLPYAGRTWVFCSFECAQTFAAAPERYVPP